MSGHAVRPGHCNNVNALVTNGVNKGQVVLPGNNVSHRFVGEYYEGPYLLPHRHRWGLAAFYTVNVSRPPQLRNAQMCRWGH